MELQFLSEYLSEGNAVLICTKENRQYLTGFASSAGYLLLVNNAAILLIDGRYFTAAKSAVKKGIEVLLQNALYSDLISLINKYNIKNLFLESEISVKKFNDFNSFLNCEVSACNGLSEALLLKRSVKNEAEVGKIIAAQRIAEKAFNNVLNFIKCGISEKDIALQLEYEMRKNGSESIAFDTICVSGVNSSLPHGVPSDKLIQNGEFITMDFGAVVDGYRSDMTRTVAVSFVTDEMQMVYDTVLNAQNAAINAVCCGNSFKNVDTAARSVIVSAGFGDYFSHSTGHGVGLNIHEYPNLSSLGNDCEKTLENSQIVTVEPGIYLPNKFGVRIEDMVLVKNNCSQNLTKAAKTLIIL